MNKQRFLAELQRLLVFMTEEDKSTVVRVYSEMFDAAGAEGEEALLSALGSPTKAAIGVSRGYEPGNIKNLPKIDNVPVSPQPAAEEKQPDEVPKVDMPSFELPTLAEEAEEPDPEAEASAEKLPRDPEPDLPEESPEPPKAERVLPPIIGAPMFALVMLVIGVPLALLGIGVMLVAVAPGCAGMLAAFLTGVGALWCVGFSADVLLMAGCAFLVLAFGVLLLWLGIWADIKLGSAYASGVRLLYGKLLGRKVDENA